MRPTLRIPPATARTPRTHSANRHGFSLAELIVAITLLTIGLGALASSSAWIIRESSSARRSERAAHIARSRFGLLRLQPCTADNGTAPHGELIERWSVSVTAGRAVAVVAVVPDNGTHLTEQRYQAAFPCQP